MVEFGKVDAEGNYEKVGTLSQAAIMRCPHAIIEYSHYREDGTCRCDDPDEQARLIREYDYAPSDFPARDREGEFSGGGEAA